MSIVKVTEITWNYPKTFTLNRLTSFKQKERGYQQGNDLDSLFGQAYLQLLDSEKDDNKFWLYKSPIFKAEFKGEGGTDQGGLYNEALSQFCIELQSNTLSLFVEVPNGQHNVGLNRDKFIPRSASNSARQLSMYTMIGKLIGTAIRNDHPLAFNFPSVVWKPLVDQNVTLDDLKDIDVMCTNILNAVRTIDKEQEITADKFENELFNEFFTTQSSDGREVELKPGGKDITVTYANRGEWVDLVIDYRLNELKFQVEAIKKGIAAVLPSPLLSLLTWKEIEILVTGNPKIDMEKLKRSTTYSGYSANSPVIKTFWKVLDSFTPEEQSMYLRFTWGRSRLPDTIGTSMNLRFMHTSGNPDSVLPTSHTCMFALDLPEYSSFEIMKKKMLYAIRECQAIDTDFNVNNADMWE